MHVLKSLSALGLLGACCITQSDAREPENAELEYATWRLPVAVAPNATKETQTLATELKESLNLKIDVVQSQANPRCCLWIEVGDTSVWPYPNGYLVVLGRGGGQILASSEEELRTAVQQLEMASRKNQDGSVRLPVAIITNFSKSQIIRRARGKLPSDGPENSVAQ